MHGGERGAGGELGEGGGEAAGAQRVAGGSGGEELGELEFLLGLVELLGDGRVVVGHLDVLVLGLLVGLGGGGGGVGRGTEDQLLQLGSAGGVEQVEAAKDELDGCYELGGRGLGGGEVDDEEFHCWVNLDKDGRKFLANDVVDLVTELSDLLLEGGLDVGDGQVAGVNEVVKHAALGKAAGKVGSLGVFARVGPGEHAADGVKDPATVDLRVVRALGGPRPLGEVRGGFGLVFSSTIGLVLLVLLLLLGLQLDLELGCQQLLELLEVVGVEVLVRLGSIDRQLGKVLLGHSAWESPSKNSRRRKLDVAALLSRLSSGQATADRIGEEAFGAALAGAGLGGFDLDGDQRGSAKANCDLTASKVGDKLARNALLNFKGSSSLERAVDGVVDGKRVGGSGKNRGLGQAQEGGHFRNLQLVLETGNTAVESVCVEDALGQLLQSA